jgi:serine/threonine protein kinase
LTTHAGKLSESQPIAVAVDLAHTLGDVHARFDAHGDVKPDNILVTHDGHLQVADPLGNGINCTVVFAQNHGGTPGYWAPEISAGGAVSASGDVYAFGATLYHLATGRRPYDGQRLDLAVKSCPVPSKIQEVITACCQSSASDRPSMKEVLRILAGERWTDIQASNRRTQGVVMAACILGGLFLFLGGLGD